MNEIHPALMNATQTHCTKSQNAETEGIDFSAFVVAWMNLVPMTQSDLQVVVASNHESTLAANDLVESVEIKQDLMMSYLLSAPMHKVNVELKTMKMVDQALEHVESKLPMIESTAVLHGKESNQNEIPFTQGTVNAIVQEPIAQSISSSNVQEPSQRFKESIQTSFKGVESEPIYVEKAAKDVTLKEHMTLLSKSKPNVRSVEVDDVQKHGSVLRDMEVSARVVDVNHKTVQTNLFKEQLDIADMTKEFVANIHAKQEEFTLKLKPEGIGELVVKFIEESGKYQIRIMTQNKEVYQLMNQRLPELSSNLKEYAITVETSSQWQGSMLNDSSSSNHRQNPRATQTKTQDEDVILTKQRVFLKDEHQINTYV